MVNSMYNNLYRVDEFGLDDKIIDTKKFKKFHTDYYEDLLPIMQLVTDVSTVTNLSISDSFVLIGMAEFFPNYKESIEQNAFIFKETHIPSGIIKAIQTVLYAHYSQKEVRFHFDSLNPSHLSCIYPFGYEAVRHSLNKQGVNIKTGRLDSAYFFTTLADCQYYINTQNLDCQIYKVEIIEEYDSFIGDMNWLESLNIKTFTSKDLLSAAECFWKNKCTNKPIMEVLFHGKYKLKPEV